MALQTVERLLKQTEALPVSEQLLLAARLIERARQSGKRMTGKDLLASGVFGIWSGRTDIGDSLEYARQLRAQAQTRRRAV